MATGARNRHTGRGGRGEGQRRGHAPFRARPARARAPARAGEAARLLPPPSPRSLGEVAAPVVHRAARGASREL